MSLSKLIDSLPDASQPGFYNVGYSGTQWHELEDEFGEPFEVDHFCLEEGLPPPNINSTVGLYGPLTAAIRKEVEGKWDDPSTYISVDGGLEDRTLRVAWNMRQAKIDESLLHFLRDYLARNLPQWRIVIPMRPDNESILVYPMAIVPPRMVQENLAEFLFRKNSESLAVRDSSYLRRRNFTIARQFFDPSQCLRESEVNIIAAIEDSRSPNHKLIHVCLLHKYVPRKRGLFAFEGEQNSEFSECFYGESNQRYLNAEGIEIEAEDSDSPPCFVYIEIACLKESFRDFIEIRDHEENCNVRIPVDAPIWDESTADAMYEEILKNESKKD